MRDSREAPIGASRARRGRWAKVPFVERWRRRVGGIFEGTRRLGGFVCGRIEVARRGASNARAGQPRRGAEGVTGGEVEPSGGRQIFHPGGGERYPRRGKTYPRRDGKVTTLGSFE